MTTLAVKCCWLLNSCSQLTYADNKNTPKTTHVHKPQTPPCRHEFACPRARCLNAVRRGVRHKSAQFYHNARTCSEPLVCVCAFLCVVGLCVRAQPTSLHHHLGSGTCSCAKRPKLYGRAPCGMYAWICVRDNEFGIACGHKRWKFSPVHKRVHTVTRRASDLFVACKQYLDIKLHIDRARILASLRCCICVFITNPVLIVLYQRQAHSAIRTSRTNTDICGRGRGWGCPCAKQHRLAHTHTGTVRSFYGRVLSSCSERAPNTTHTHILAMTCARPCTKFNIYSVNRMVLQSITVRTHERRRFDDGGLLFVKPHRVCLRGCCTT